eukprot:SM000019S04990  [mRNA]  locus=s19:336397:338944:- [translate_table: standard]
MGSAPALAQPGAGRFRIYVHAPPGFKYNRSTMALTSDLFIDTEIAQTGHVHWGDLDVVEAEKRLLAVALLDPRNTHFLLLSESCIPIRSFDYAYDYLLGAETSFVDSYIDYGPHGAGRYHEGDMLPEVRKSDWRKGSQVPTQGCAHLTCTHVDSDTSAAAAQWFALQRRHAKAVVADRRICTKFRWDCKNHPSYHCYADEHYIQTFLHMTAAAQISNFSVTFADWSARSWHPKSFAPEDCTEESVQQLQGLTFADRPHTAKIDLGTLTWTDPPLEELLAKLEGKGCECRHNSAEAPCFLFARKFTGACLDALLQLPAEVLGY